MRRENHDGGVRGGITAEALLSHSRWLTTLARALVHGDADAADVVQQTLTRALSSPPRSAARLRSWLRRIAQNVVRSRARADLRRASRELLAPRPDPPASPELAVARAELRRRAVEAVLALAEPYRATLIMRFFDEMEAEEIAHTMKVPVETVRTRVKRGLAQLRERFREEFGGDDRDWTRAFAPFLRPFQPALPTVAAVVVILGAWQFLSRAPAPLLASQPSAAAAPAPPVGPPLLSATVERAPLERASEPAEASSNCSLTGTVRDDLGRPVAGAWVGVGHPDVRFFDIVDLARARAGAAGERAARTIRRMRSTTTGADGGFTFDGLDLYESWAIGACDRDAGVAWLQEVPLRRPGRSDRVDLQLTRCTRIVGRVTDAAGRAVGSAWIAGVAGLPGRNFYLSARSRADAGHEGEYALDALPGTRFELRAVTSDGLDSDPVCVEIGPASADAPVSIERRVDLRVEVDLLHHPRGRLRSADGTPARLSDDLLPRLSAEERSAPLNETLTVVLLGERPPRLPCPLVGTPWFGMGRVLVDRDEYVFDATDLADPQVHRVGFAVRNQIVGVADLVEGAGLPDLLLALDALPDRPCAAERGRVVVVLHGSTETVASDPDALELELEPVPSCASRALPPGRPRPIGPDRIEFAEVSAGEWYLRARCDGCASVTRRGVVAPGDAATIFDVELRPASGRLYGTVTDPSGGPVGAAQLYLYEWSGGTASAIATRGLRTNSSGRFACDGLERATYRLVACAPGFAPAWIESDGDAASGPVALVLAAGERVVARLAAPEDRALRNIQWRIVDAAGVPVIDDRHPDLCEFDWVDHRDAQLLPGRYRIEAWADDLSGSSELVVNGTTESILPMTTAAALRAR